VRLHTVYRAAMLLAMRAIDVISLVGSTIGTVGGVFGFVTWMQAQRDRRRGRVDERRYERRVSSWIDSIASGDGTTVIQVSSGKDRKYAARAVREQRLAWSGYGTSLTLPQV
jgi:hypothetical protein